MIDRVVGMAAPRLLVPVMAMALLLLVAGVGAQTSSSNCTSATTSLTPCLTYILGSDSTPGTQCCAAVALLNTNNPECLCEVVAQLNSTAYVNITKGYELPSECGINANAAACPALAPALAPAIVPSPPLFDFSPPPPASANSTSAPGSAAPALRPCSALPALVSVFFSAFWVGAWQIS